MLNFFVLQFKKFRGGLVQYDLKLEPSEEMQNHTICKKCTLFVKLPTQRCGGIYLIFSFRKIREILKTTNRIQIS